MPHSLNDILDNAKCCSVGMSRKYVNAVQHGEDDAMQKWDLYELNGLIHTLERENCRGTKLFDSVELGTLTERVAKICSNCNCN